MTTRNFRVHNGISVGDIVIDASANTIVGLATAAPSADGDVSNKKYVDDQDAAIASDTLTFTNKTIDANGTGNSITNIEVADFAGTAIINVSETLASNDSDTALVTAGAIIDYVDAQDANIAGDTLTFTNKTFDANGTGNSITNIEVADFAGTAIINVSETLASNDSDTALVTAGAIIDYVDAQDANIASDTLTFTNKTFDANGTGNSITNIDIANMTAASIVLESEGIASNDNDTSLPTSAAVLDYVTTAVGAVSTTAITQLDTSATVSDSGSNGAFVVVADGNTELTINDTSATFNGNVVVSGNFTVNGTTTTVATTNTTVTDALIEYANGTTGTPANDAGIVIERGDSANAFIGFDESEDKFRVGTGTFTGASTGNLTITTGTLLANIEGNVTGNVTGNADTATALATARAIGGVNFDGTAAINLPGVNQAGNQNTSGTAAIGTAVTVTANNATDETVYLTFVDGATGTQGIETDTGLTYNPSTNVLTTTASSARYADVAERFEADAPMEIGSVVEVGGSAEITEATSEMSEDVFGVISHKPAYMMNSGAGTDESHPFVAMTGRTPVRVTGVVTKGQRLVTSSIKGCARAVASGESITPFNVIGRALESNTEAGIKLVNCAVRSNN